MRIRNFPKFMGGLRRLWFSFQGMKIGSGTYLKKIHVTWPNQVSIGNNCKLEHDVYFKYSGIWKPGQSIVMGDRVFIGTGCEFNIHDGISIGSDSLIASGCRFIDHDHGVQPGELIRLQQPKGKPIVIANDVWLGCNVVVLKGVEIGTGAVVAAGAVVTKSILPMEIWGGVPAKKIGDRNPNQTAR